MMDWKLELIVVPVTDVDRAKAFYMDRAGFGLDVDHRAGEDFRVVQLTPPGSACSSKPFHFGAGGRQPGPDPERRGYGTFLSFDDPDGNGWLVQEVRPAEAA
jgi:catechol 2,3-dioxygenase-like lactoylglutathione lyase family enzyme